MTCLMRGVFPPGNWVSFCVCCCPGCCKRAETSSTATLRHCRYATNAGFFDTKNGCCVGNLIVNSSIQIVSGDPHTCHHTIPFFFMCVCVWLAGGHQSGQHWSEQHPLCPGLHCKLDTGHRQHEVHSFDIWCWMAGQKVRLYPLLVTRTVSLPLVLLCRGVSYIKTSMVKENLQDKFATEKAPRTALVLHQNGTLSLMQVRECCVRIMGIIMVYFRWTERRTLRQDWISLNSAKFLWALEHIMQWSVCILRNLVHFKVSVSLFVCVCLCRILMAEAAVCLCLMAM